MSADEHYAKGMEHFIQDNLEEAVNQLSQALEADPKHCDALQALSMSYFHLKDLENAVRYGERLRDLTPDDAMAYTSLSMFYQAQGRIQEAEDMGAQAAKLSKR